MSIHKQRRRSDPCRVPQPGRSSVRETRSTSIADAEQLADRSHCLCGRYVPDTAPHAGFRHTADGVVTPTGNRICPSCFAALEWVHLTHFDIVALSDLADEFELWIEDAIAWGAQQLLVSAIRTSVRIIRDAHEMSVNLIEDPIDKAIAREHERALIELRKVVDYAQEIV